MKVDKYQNQAMHRALCKALAKIYQKPLDYYYYEPQNVIQAVLNYGSFSQLAQLANLDKIKTYKWFHDTFMRQNSLPITQEDRKYIESQIANQLAQGKQITKEFKDLIKQQLSRQYYRSEFSIRFNNILKRVKNSQKSGQQKKKQFHFNAFERN